MEKPLAASKSLMRSYLSDLLTEDILEERAEKTEKLNKLLQNVTVTEQQEDKVLDTIVSKKSADIKLPEPELELAQSFVDETPVVTATEVPIAKEKSTSVSSKEYREGSFQAMFFDVAGLTVAVPLVELGGIHNLDKTTNLLGKPQWFAGVMVHREEKINVVDTALWVMPEKYNETLKESLNYQYVIMLSDTNWGLLAENLVDTVTLQPEDVKWIDNNPKRPWLAGLVKDRMCALLEVESLIKLLDDGINVQQL